MGSLLESMWSQRGVIATLAYGSGLSEWDLAESTPGTREYLFTLSLGIRGGMYYVVMVHTPETKKSHRVKQALTHTIYTYTGRGVLMKNWDHGEHYYILLLGHKTMNG